MNYSELSDAELDRLSAEMVGEIKKYKRVNQLTARHSMYGYDVLEVDGVKVVEMLDWHPTDPDSNQTERYLFKNLRELGDGLWVRLGYYLNYRTEIFNSGERIVCWECKNDPDQINRIKVIACLEAWDKLNNSE